MATAATTTISHSATALRGPIALLISLCLIHVCQSFTSVTPLSARSPLKLQYKSTPRSRSPHSVKLPSSSSASALWLRRKILTEDDLAEPPDKKVMDAVEGMNGNQVLASDVAAKAGVSLSLASRQLSALSALTQGEIAVTESGDLLYTFPGSIKSTLASNSLRYKVTSTWEKDIWPNLFWGIRVGFGVSIFVSLFAIFSTFLFISAGGGSDDDRDDRGGRRGGGMSPGLMFDLFYPRPLYFSNSRYYGYYGRYDPYARLGRYERNKLEEEDDEPNFFEKIFSYIFGDGNPNRGLEAARLRGAAEMIRSNGGSVCAEQLAPFCDVLDPEDIGSGTIVDESFVLPIVTQLGGEPTVTEEGDIVYLFPDLQVSTGRDENLSDDESKYNMLRRMRGEATAQKMEILEEQPIEFSRTGQFGKLLAGGLGVVNLGGALYLGQVLSSPAMAGVQLPGIYGAVQGGYPLLLAYAVLYNAIPLVRFILTKKANADIESRNSARRRWLTVLKEGGSKVKRKLRSAASMRQKMRRLGGKVDVVYDTTSDFADVSTDKAKEDMKRFDELLEDEERGEEGIFE